MTPFILLALVVLAVIAASGWKTILVRTGTVSLVYRDGAFARQLEPGRHRMFDPMHRTEVTTIPTIATPTAAYSLSLMTRDQFAFRALVVAIQRISDPRAYHEARPSPASKPSDHLFFLALSQADRLQPELASTMLAWASARSLEEIVAAPSDGLGGLIPGIEAELSGVTIEKLLLTDLTVPPEVRKMFTEVERARREGLAQLERARGEQASLRALANAARALEANPQLARLRMLQTMEGAKGNKTFILGSASVDAGVQLP